VLIVLRTDN